MRMASANACMNWVGWDARSECNGGRLRIGRPGLALRVVERYFGREIAQATATYMEYQGKGWIV